MHKIDCRQEQYSMELRDRVRKVMLSSFITRSYLALLLLVLVLRNLLLLASFNAEETNKKIFEEDIFAPIQMEAKQHPHNETKSAPKKEDIFAPEQVVEAKQHPHNESASNPGQVVEEKQHPHKEGKAKSASKPGQVVEAKQHPQNEGKAKSASKEGPALKKNPWFDGVFDTMTPLEVFSSNLEENGTETTKKFCHISRDFQDDEERPGFYEDKVLPILEPYTRSPGTGNRTSFGGVTTQKFGFPCPLEDVLVAYSEPLNWTKPSKKRWKRLVNEMKDYEEKKDVRDTSQVWYSCIDDLTKKRSNHQTLTFGINPTHGLQQIEVARRYYSQMNYPKNDGPLDLYMIVIDSTSRSSFHRSFPSLVHNMRKKEWPIDVFEMFRYSSIAWGTMRNMGILLHGCGQTHSARTGGSKYPEELCNEMHVPLHLWLAASGYLLMGNYSFSTEGQRHQFGQVFQGNHTSESRHTRFGRRLQADLYVDLALDQSAFYSRHAPELPQYFAIHLDDNHIFDHGMKGQESSLIRLLNGIDFANRNSMVIIMADHGVYTSPTPLRAIEAFNPLLLAAVSNGALSSEQTNVWKENQQRLANHWDTHATLKSLPLQFGTGWPKIEDYCRLDGKHGAATCGPHYYNSSKARAFDTDRSGQTLPWQNNFMLSRIPENRTCSDAMSRDSFCICGGVPEEGREWTDEESNGILHNVASELNKWTGNGTLDCRLFQAEEFIISNTLSYGKSLHVSGGSLAGHHILTVDSKSTKASYSVVVNQTMQAKYATNKYKLFAPIILRQDRFDEEKCLITYPDGRMPIFKSNSTAGKDLMLRWCSCKSSTLHLRGS